MELADAQYLAQQVVETQERKTGVPLGINVGATQRLLQGWAFYWNSRAFLASRDLNHSLVGHGPLIVLDDGRILEGGSAESPEDVLYRFGLAGRPDFDAMVVWSPWKGEKHTGTGDYYARCLLEGEPPDAETYSIRMTRTPERNIWSVRFDIPAGPHEKFRPGVRLIVFEGSREAARAELTRKRARPVD
jgi:hypothetical protein